MSASRIRILKGRGEDKALTRFARAAANASSSSLSDKGIELPASLHDRVETKITTLPNGVRIASQSSSNHHHPATSIGLYVNCGSIHETPLSLGAAHLLERMAFKSTANRSHLRVVREVEAIGGNVTASASREQMSYRYDALKIYVPQMVELLVDSVRNQALLDEEVTEQIQRLKAEYWNINPESLVLEAIHSAGYSGALANPLLASEGSLKRLDSTILQKFVHANYTAPRIVLAAYGVEHEELLKYAEPILSDLPGGAQVEEPNSVYVGGDHRVMADTGRTSFAVAFELPGGWLNVKDAMTLTVLQMLMGGADSFSAGGPGKGKYSRLYLRVLNEYPEFHSFSAFTSIYNNTAIFGIQGTTSPVFAEKAIDVAAEELVSIADEGAVRRQQLERAKQSAKSAILTNLESRMLASEDIGRQILAFRERKPTAYFLKLIDQVSDNDITSMVERLLESPLTMASHGDVTSIPAYDSAVGKFR